MESKKKMPKKPQAKLHKATGKNKWCGPVAISILTGKTSCEAAQVIKDHRETDKAVKGTFIEDMEAALEEFGFKLKRIEIPKRKGRHLSLLNWVQMIRNKHRIFLIGTKNHWMVYGSHRAADTGNKEPVWIQEFKRKSRPVLSCWEVLPQTGTHIRALASKYNLLDSDLEKLEVLMEGSSDLAKLEKVILLAKQIDWGKNASV